MIRTSYRMFLCAACALAAGAGPVIFLEDQFRMGYVAGGLVAALLTWLFLTLVIRTEAQIPLPVRAVLGAGSALLSWMTVTLVAVFDVIPHALAGRAGRFDPVWVLGGLAPAFIPLIALRLAAKGETGFGQALSTILFRFSFPPLAVEVLARILPLPKQYQWLALFTGLMFVVLEGLTETTARPDAALPPNHPLHTIYTK